MYLSVAGSTLSSLEAVLPDVRMLFTTCEWEIFQSQARHRSISNMYCASWMQKIVGSFSLFPKEKPIKLLHCIVRGEAVNQRQNIQVLWNSLSLSPFGALCFVVLLNIAVHPSKFLVHFQPFFLLYIRKKRHLVHVF